MKKLSLIMNMKAWAELSSSIFWIGFMRLHTLLPDHVNQHFHRIYTFTTEMIITLFCK